jgi:AcrR family transcriptional regulator
MGRPKTITDEEILAVARRVFRAEGHEVSTRQLAEAAGISPGVLYQRFGSKDELFFAAMAPTPPDIEEVLGPDEPTDDGHEYMRRVLVRMAEHFAAVLPLAFRMMMHPSFDPAMLVRAQTATRRLHAGLETRLAHLAHRGTLREASAGPAAATLVSLAHDWAVGRVMSPRGPSAKSLEALVDEVIWPGTMPEKERRKRPR